MVGRRRKIGKQAGFSLAELMVVSVIIALISGFGVSKIQTFVARARQVEARSALSGIYLSMHGYYAHHGEYPMLKGHSEPEEARIGFATQGRKAMYGYLITSKNTCSCDPEKSSSNGYWVASAMSKASTGSSGGAPRFDILRLNTNRWMCQPYDGISGKSARVRSSSSTLAGGESNTDCPESSNGSADWRPTLTDADMP